MKHLLCILLLVPPPAWASEVFPKAIDGRWFPEADSDRISKLYEASEVPTNIDAEAIRQAAIEGMGVWLKRWPKPSCTNVTVGEPRVTQKGESIVWAWCTVRKHDGRDSEGFSHFENETTAYLVVVGREGISWKFKRGYESRLKIMVSS